MEITKRNYKAERARQKQREDLAAVDKILQSKNKTDFESTERR